MEIINTIELVENTNTLAIQTLMELSRIAALRGDVYRSSAFMRAATEIEKINSTGDTGEIIASRKKIPGVGKHIRGILDELVSTGKCKELEDLKTNDIVAVAENLTKILGVGSVSAYEFAKAGISNASQLLEAARKGRVKLTTAQTLGAEHHEHLKQRIPRDTVSAIGKLVIFHAMKHMDLEDAHVAGSFRRNSSSSSDVDVLLVIKKRSTIGNTDSLRDLPGFVGFVSKGETRISFLLRYDGIVRLVDILVCDKSEVAAALLYFTGSWEFNEAMRRHAKANHYTLNQTGLYKHSSRKTVKLSMKTEEDIFAALGLRYVSPELRIGPESIVGVNTKDPEKIIQVTKFQL